MFDSCCGRVSLARDAPRPLLDAFVGRLHRMRLDIRLYNGMKSFAAIHSSILINIINTLGCAKRPDARPFLPPGLLAYLLP